MGLLEHIVHLASAWLHRVLQAREHEAYCRTTEALLCISQMSSQSITLQDLIDEIISLVQYVTEADRVCLYMVDEVENEFWVANSSQSDTCTGKQHGTACWCVSTCTPYRIHIRQSYCRLSVFVYATLLHRTSHNSLELTEAQI